MGLAVSVVTTLLSLIVCVLFSGTIFNRYYLEPAITKADIVFLLLFLVFVYQLMILVKVKTDVEFEKAYKVTLHLLTWPSLIIIAIVGFYSLVVIWNIIFISANHAEGFLLVFYALLYGMPTLSVLSLLGFVIDSVLNKIKRNRIQG